MKSIVQKTKECIACRTQYRKFNPYVECPHVYFGEKRKISDRNGFTVWLCPEHHRGLTGVHGKHGHDLDLWLKRLTQKTYEEKHSREDFIRLIGKNYLED